MAGQPSNDFLQMQRDAEKRVMEMQRRAKSRVESAETAASKPPLQTSPAVAPQPPAKKHSFLDVLNLKTLFEGKDTSLVLMVLALLNSHETDPILMLALLYIML